MEKLLVTQALDERDFLRKKIIEKIRNAAFVDVAKPNDDKTLISKTDREEFAKEAEATWQSINDMIARYERICAAIVESNARTNITTSCGMYTVAAAISLRDSMSISDNSFYENLISALQHPRERAIQLVDEKNRAMQQSAEQMRLAILGRDKQQSKDAAPLAVVEEFVKENTAELFDPIHTDKKFEELRERRTKLFSEIQTQIKISNATTYIEF